MGEWVVTDRMLRSNPSNVLALANKHGCVRVVDENGATVQRVVVHRDAIPTRTRIHVGYRVVRERDGVREWWSTLGGFWTPYPTIPWSQRPIADYGGRVVKVFLSYSAETRNGRGR